MKQNPSNQFMMQDFGGLHHFLGAAVSWGVECMHAILCLLQARKHFGFDRHCSHVHGDNQSVINLSSKYPHVTTVLKYPYIRDQFQNFDSFLAICLMRTRRSDKW